MLNTLLFALDCLSHIQDKLVAVKGQPGPLQLAKVVTYHYKSSCPQLEYATAKQEGHNNISSSLLQCHQRTCLFDSADFPTPCKIGILSIS